MIDYKLLAKKLLFPPLWLILLLIALATPLLMLIFLRGMDTHPLAYAVYVFSFYTLTVLCIHCALVFPKRYKAVKAKMYATKLGNHFLTDAAFRTRVSLYVSLGFNLLYAALNAVYGVVSHSAWFAILSGYYAILAVMRFLLLRYFGRHAIGADMIDEWRRARACALILILVNLTLTGGNLMILYMGRGFTYPGMLIYVVASYTFYITVTAIMNMVKYRQYNSPVLMSAKAVTLAAALVSMLSLESAMLTAFGADTPPETKRALIAATGGVISVVVLTVSLYMIVRSVKEIKKLTSEKTQNA